MYVLPVVLYYYQKPTREASGDAVSHNVLLETYLITDMCE